MSKVGIRELKQNASAVVAEAAAGEAVTITLRGNPVAQMVPLSTSRMESLVAAERIRPARRSLGELPEPAKAKRGRTSISEALSDMRSSERY